MSTNKKTKRLNPKSFYWEKPPQEAQPDCWLGGRQGIADGLRKQRQRFDLENGSKWASSHKESAALGQRPGSRKAFLTINAAELKKLLEQDTRLSRVDIDVANPGEYEDRSEL